MVCCMRADPGQLIVGRALLQRIVFDLTPFNAFVALLHPLDFVLRF